MTYDFIVVGAGISGAASAYHLRETGANVLLIERGEPASGGTGKSAAIIRQSYSTPLLVRLAHASITMLARAKDELGQDAGLVQSGYCFLIASDMLDGARRNVAMQKALGIVNEWCDGAGFGQHLPDLNPDGIAAIVYEPHGGYADPVRATEAYVAAFRRLGGELQSRTPVRRLVRRGDRVAGVELDTGTISASFVVNAAGPWAKPLAESAGLALPLRTVREQDTVWQVPAGRKLPSASISNGVDAIYLRPLGHGRFIIGRGFPKDYVDVDPYNYRVTADDAFIADVQARAEHRFPAFAGMKLIEAYAALYDVTPDWYPFVGPRGGIEGYADFCGGSGHGFKIAPSIARELADWLIAGKVADDFRQLSHDRIATDNLFVQSFGGNRG
jgi:glycine/D-amino acid oxidase-like deaminating enzyme